MTTNEVGACIWSQMI